MSNVDRAEACYEAMQRHFYRRHSKLYRETFPDTGDNSYAYLWPFSQALAATVAMAGIPGVAHRFLEPVRDRVRGLKRYWDGRSQPPGYGSSVRFPLGGGGDKYYDDNEWVGLELLRIHDLTGDSALLDRAKQVFDLVVSGWDDDPSHPAAGGIFWTQVVWNHDRNTVSNAPAAELGLRLYEITGESPFFEWAKRMYQWTRRYLLGPNELYWDHVDADGQVETTQWSYNQGTMVGAGVLLYRATGDEAYLTQAKTTAEAALARYGAEDSYFRQPAAFNAIFFTNLQYLATECADPEYSAAMDDYANRAWVSVRDPATGLFRFDPSGPATLLDQAAMIRIYACLAAQSSG